MEESKVDIKHRMVPRLWQGFVEFMKISQTSVDVAAPVGENCKKVIQPRWSSSGGLYLLIIHTF